VEDPVGGGDVVEADRRSRAPAAHGPPRLRPAIPFVALSAQQGHHITSCERSMIDAPSCCSRGRLAAADDWTQFQGPRGDGTSPERITLREWPAQGPPSPGRRRSRWAGARPRFRRARCSSPGPSSRTAWPKTIACLDAASGAEKWKHTYEIGPYWKRNIGWAPGGFRSTPAVDDRSRLRARRDRPLPLPRPEDRRGRWMKNLWDEWFPSGEKGLLLLPHARRRQAHPVLRRRQPPGRQRQEGVLRPLPARSIR
jgi:hypothetical protein